MDFKDLFGKTREEMLESVKEAATSAVDELMEAYKNKKAKVKEEEEESDEDKKEEESDEEDDSEDKKEEESDEEDEKKNLTEALKITAAGPRNTIDDFVVKDMRELARIAKTGKYGWFMVTRPNGTEEEYIVEKGKLVLM